MRRALPLALCLVLAACGGSQPAPAAPTAPAVTVPTPPPPDVIFTGQVNAAATGQPLAGETVDVASRDATTDAAGAFRFDFAPAILSPVSLLTISGPNILTHHAEIISTTSRDLPLSAIAMDGGFDLAFYRELVRDNHDSPGLLRPLRRWTTSPRIYLRTIDDAGNPVESATVDAVQSLLADSISEWTSGGLGLAGLERGTDTREGQSGWITIKWPAVADPNVCGMAQIAVDGGWISFDYKNSLCAAPCSHPSRIAPLTVRHELGHALGFYHTDDTHDVMWGSNWDISMCDQHPSARERYHAAIAYTRAFGNSDPDDDPPTTYLRTSGSGPIVVN